MESSNMTVFRAGHEGVNPMLHTILSFVLDDSNLEEASQICLTSKVFFSETKYFIGALAEKKSILIESLTDMRAKDRIQKVFLKTLGSDSSKLSNFFAFQKEIQDRLSNLTAAITTNPRVRRAHKKFDETTQSEVRSLLELKANPDALYCHDTLRQMAQDRHPGLHQLFQEFRD